MIPAEFDDIRDFDGGYALAQKDGEDVAINTAGDVVYRFEGWEDTVSHVGGAYFCEEAAGRRFSGDRCIRWKRCQGVEDQ